MLILFAALFVSCSDDDDGNEKVNMHNIMWMQDVGEVRHFFVFWSDGKSGYIKTNTNNDNYSIYNYLWPVYSYSMDKENKIVIVKNNSDNIYEDEKPIWLTGYYKDDTIYLTGENESYILKRAPQKPEQ